MYKTLQEAACQENAYKSMVADLTSKLNVMAEANKKAHNNTPLADAHAALDSILYSEWATPSAGPSKLPSIAEANDENDSSAKVIQLGHSGVSTSPGPNSPTARVLELQRQVGLLHVGSSNVQFVRGWQGAPCHSAAIAMRCGDATVTLSWNGCTLLVLLHRSSR